MAATQHKKHKTRDQSAGTNTASPNNQSFDVIINGSGMVGGLLAALLCRSGLSIAVIETDRVKKIAPDDRAELRVSAISSASKKAFVDAGVWRAMVQQRVSPYETMRVWDATGDGEVNFEAASLGEAELGHIIENRVIQAALMESLETEEKVHLYCPDRIEAFDVNKESVSVYLESGIELRAELLVGADGANSLVREQSEINFNRDDYGQSGLVAVVETENPHQNTAWQCFHPEGPLAFLPLSDGRCSIVWTLPSDKADYYLSRSEKKFKLLLAESLQHRLGEIRSVGKRAAFPLAGAQADHYVLERIALVGDAAHTIHPLAGQGVNLGIKDAVELADTLTKARRRQLDYDLGKRRLLRRYERARRGDNVLTMRAMEGFRILFGHSAPAVKSLRNIGMRLFDRSELLKNEVIRKATGF